MKISSGQFVVYADLDLSKEVSARNIYLHVCLCSEEKGLKGKMRESNCFRNKERITIFK